MDTLSSAVPIVPDAESKVLADPVELIIPEDTDLEVVAVSGAQEVMSELLEQELTPYESPLRNAGTEQIKVDELAATVDRLTERLRADQEVILAATVDRLTERLRADQEVIGQMQSRIESLQGDRVRVLLGPVVTELANLCAAFAEAAERDYERLGFDRVRKEFTLLGDRLESTIDVLGAVSVDARVGDPFDSRVHQALKQVPTGDASLDKTIANVIRQGFTFDPDGKPALYARVSVYLFDPTLDTPTEASTDTEPLVVDSDPNPSSITALSEVSSTLDNEIEIPYPFELK